MRLPETVSQRLKWLPTLSDTQLFVVLNSIGIATFICASVSFFSQYPCATQQMLEVFRR